MNFVMFYIQFEILKQDYMKYPDVVVIEPLLLDNYL